MAHATQNPRSTITSYVCPREFGIGDSVQDVRHSGIRLTQARLQSGNLYTVPQVQKCDTSTWQLN